MSAEKIHLTEEKETLLMTLYARALDAREKDPLLADHTAEEIVRRIDYDFERLRLNVGDRTSIAIRARHLDDWTRAFLAETPDATVIQLGCGLDSRVVRVGPSDETHWYDLDYPDVIAIRRRFFDQMPRYHMIGSPVTDPGWLAAVPTERPLLVIAEGLLMYLAPEDVRRLFERLVERFPTGEIIFDAMNSLAGRIFPMKPAVRRTGATFRWTPDDSREIEKFSPRLAFVEEQSIVGSPYVDRMPWPYRLACGAMDQVGILRNVMRLVRYHF